VGISGGCDGIGSLSVVSEVGLVVESPLEEAVCCCSLSRAAYLATPEAAELGGLDSVAGHWSFEELGEDLAAPFEDFLVNCFQLLGIRRDKLAGIR
jgi:hypothetical protein